MEIVKHADTLQRLRVFIGIAVFLVLLSGSQVQSYAQANDLTPGSSWILPDQLFYSGKSTLNSNAKTELNQLGRYLEARPDLQIIIEGHWDNSLSEEKAQIVSEARAKVVKNYLVKNHNFNPDYIKTVGYGSLRPLVNNNTNESKIKNRRIEITSLTSYTSKPVTKDSRAINCAAYLALIDGAVQTKAPWDVDFLKGRYQQQIYEQHKISVFFRSRSALRLKDGSMIRMFSNSRVTFNGSQQANDYPNLEIGKGKVEIDLLPSVVRKQFVIKIPNGEIVMLGTKAAINVETINDSLYVLFSLFKGNARVTINNSVLNLNEGQGFMTAGRHSPVKVQSIPNEPKPILPLDNQTVSSGSTVFSWVDTSYVTLFEVSKKNDFKSFVIQKQTPGNELGINLASGTYYWRMRHIAENGLESNASEPRRIFVTSEYISHRLVEKNISKAFEEGAVAKLELNVQKDTLVKEKIFTLKGRTDPGSKIFIDNYQLKTQNLRGVFTQKMQLDKGKNEITVRVRAQNGLENSKEILVDFEPPSRFKFFIMTGALFPASLKHHDYGFQFYAGTDYRITDHFLLKGVMGMGALIAQPEAYAKTNGGNELTSTITSDFGLAFVLFPNHGFTPVLEGSFGLMFWNRSTTPVFSQSSLHRVSLSPSIGLGLKFKVSDRYFSLGGYYRDFQHLDEKLDLNTQNKNDSVVEVRLGFWM